jgi:hypothetical protein
MPVLKNPRHERFAQIMAEGKTCVDAYQLAGFKRDDGNSSRLLSARPEIQARFQELIGKLEARAAKRHEITTDSLVAEIEEAASWARRKRDSRAYVDAVKHKAILSGKWIEKTAVGTPSEFAEIEAMSRAELIEFIRATLESGELALDHKPESDQENECV